MDKLPPKRKKKCDFTTEQLLELDKTELVDIILQYKAHNQQLRNIISKKQDGQPSSSTDRNNRPFDFSRCSTRRIFLRIMYFGWDYQGLAVQEDSTHTIEHYLFDALTKTCLIESRETSNYHRCGRTDKGVSAFGQIMSISIRSKFPPESQEEVDSINNELPYCKMLNRLLPKEIRAVCWMPISSLGPEYSARFDCKRRTYKYYFPRGQLDITGMRHAAAALLGSRDHRNLCTMDVGNGVTRFIRQIYRADIVSVDGGVDEPTSMFYLLIEGNAFLWHQIRCIFGILLLVGQKREKPDIMERLLDVENNPCKPQYSLALDLPLNLFHCAYDIEDSIQWVYDREELKYVIQELQAFWTMHNIKATMIKDCISELEKDYQKVANQKEMEVDSGVACERDSIISYDECLLQGVKPKVYKPLMERDTCLSLEDRIEYYKKKRKIDT